MSPQIFPASQRWKFFSPVWNIETNFSSFPKMEKFCPSMALSWSVRVSKLFMHILLGLVQTNCPSLEPALLHNFSVHWKICPSVESHASMQNPNFRFWALCPRSRQSSECWTPFEKFAPVCCQIQSWDIPWLLLNFSGLLGTDDMLLVISSSGRSVWCSWSFGRTTLSQSSIRPSSLWFFQHILDGGNTSLISGLSSNFSARGKIAPMWHNKVNGETHGQVEGLSHVFSNSGLISLSETLLTLLFRILYFQTSILSPI